MYKQTSALATLMGTWSYTASGFSLTVTIATNGTFTGTDSNNCAYAGSFGIINPEFNAYSETYTRTCNGTTLTFTGLATYLRPAVVPAPTSKYWRTIMPPSSWRPICNDRTHTRIFWLLANIRVLPS